MASSHLSYDPERFAQSYGREPFRLTHHLQQHPLFELERLVELAKALPPRRVEWNAGQIDRVMAKADGPSNGLSAEETIRQIEECGSWMVLKHIQLDAEYGELLRQCVQEIAPALPPGQTPFHLQGFLFISSPGAITPFHLDPEVNFLLQIRGSKVMTIHDPNDRQVVSIEELESFAAGGHRNLRMDREPLTPPHEYALQPGDGLHVPFHAPHSVVNGDAVSISFSVTFQTRESDQVHGVLWMNHKLRRLGLKPKAHGTSRWIDRSKYALFGSLRAVKRLF